MLIYNRDFVKFSTIFERVILAVRGALVCLGILAHPLPPNYPPLNLTEVSLVTGRGDP